MNMMFKWVLTLFLALFFYCISVPAQASGGIALGATRVIYPAGAKQTSLPIINSNAHERYLINAWIEDATGNKTHHFVVTPPLFVSEARSENTLRIIYVGPPLPADRESLFWLNVKAIPSQNKDHNDRRNVLQLAVLSRIKVFVRPRDLATPPVRAPALLRFSRTGDQLAIANPSPYYITLVNLRLGDKKLENLMVPPMGHRQQALPKGSRGDLSWQSVNDYGAITPLQRVGIN